MARERALLLPWGESLRSTGRGGSPGNKNVDDDDNDDYELEKVLYISLLFR